MTVIGENKCPCGDAIIAHYNTTLVQYTSIKLHSDQSNLQRKMLFSDKKSIKSHSLMPAPLRSVLGDKTCYLAAINQSLQ